MPNLVVPEFIRKIGDLRGICEGRVQACLKARLARKLAKEKKILLSEMAVVAVNARKKGSNCKDRKDPVDHVPPFG